MRAFRFFLAFTLVGALMVACSDGDAPVAPDAQMTEVELSDALPGEAVINSVTETYFDFASALPNSVFFPLAGNLDWEIGGRDCCIRDDVVELYINQCWIGEIDSRGGPDGTHKWEYFQVRLPPGTYSIEYRNVISSVGPSGWYASWGDQPFGTVSAAVVPSCFVHEIDIHPGSWPNSINRRSRGVTPVAILGSADFDVTTVDVTTLVFTDIAEPAHDLTDPLVYAEHLQDVNSDGFTDLVTHWRTTYLDLPDGTTEACMVGAYFYGCDYVNIVY
jgi:hypothetical protein